jgi:hypothetical protein
MPTLMTGTWRLLDEQNRGRRKKFHNYGKCDKLNYHLLSSLFNLLFYRKSIYNYGLRSSSLPFKSTCISILLGECRSFSFPFETGKM